jgi:hypothetical protein
MSKRQIHVALRRLGDAGNVGNGDTFASIRIYAEVWAELGHFGRDLSDEMWLGYGDGGLWGRCCFQSIPVFLVVAHLKVVLAREHPLIEGHRECPRFAGSDVVTQDRPTHDGSFALVVCIRVTGLDQLFVLLLLLKIARPQSFSCAHSSIIFSLGGLALSGGNGMKQRDLDF